jgi:hypothetical protein
MSVQYPIARMIAQVGIGPARGAAVVPQVDRLATGGPVYDHLNARWIGGQPDYSVGTGIEVGGYGYLAVARPPS